jgi:hypothetical protein
MWNSLGSSFGNFADLLMSEANRRRTAKENEEKLAKLEKAEAAKEAESKRRWDEEHKLRTGEYTLKQNKDSREQGEFNNSSNFNRDVAKWYESNPNADIGTQDLGSIAAQAGVYGTKPYEGGLAGIARSQEQTEIKNTQDNNNRDYTMDVRKQAETERHNKAMEAIERAKAAATAAEKKAASKNIDAQIAIYETALSNLDAKLGAKDAKGNSIYESSMQGDYSYQQGSKLMDERAQAQKIYLDLKREKAVLGENNKTTAADIKIEWK